MRADPVEAAAGATAVARESGHARRPSAARQSLQTYCVSASSDGTVRASAVDPGAVHFDSMEGAQHASMVTEEGDEVHVVVRPMRASGETWTTLLRLPAASIPQCSWSGMKGTDMRDPVHAMMRSCRPGAPQRPPL